MPNNETVAHHSCFSIADDDPALQPGPEDDALFIIKIIKDISVAKLILADRIKSLIIIVKNAGTVCISMSVR